MCVDSRRFQPAQDVRVQVGGIVESMFRCLPTSLRIDELALSDSLEEVDITMTSGFGRLFSRFDLTGGLEEPDLDRSVCLGRGLAGTDLPLSESSLVFSLICSNTLRSLLSL